MSDMTELPDGFGIVTDDPLCLHDPERGIVIDVSDRERAGRIHDRYPWKVEAAREQRREYVGVCNSRSDARRTAIAVAQRLV
jgi:hypothetical protein